MAANYTSNPTATQAPSPAPAPNALPIISLPADTDGATWANLFQAFKTGIDFVGWAMQVLGGTRTAKSIQVDAIGGTVVAGAAGQVGCQTVNASSYVQAARLTSNVSVVGTTIPTPTLLAQNLYNGMVPIAAGSVGNAAGVITLNWGFGIVNITRVSAGKVNIDLRNPAPSVSRASVLCTLNTTAVIGFTVPACYASMIAGGATAQIATVNILEDGSGFLKNPDFADLDFYFAIFGG